MAFTFKHGDRPLDDFTIQRGVGRGGFGEVYYAISDGGREVALKYLRENPQVELRGVSHCINLKSPYLVTIFDVKKNAEGEYFIVMEYVAGPSLRDLLIAEPDGIGLQKAAFFLRELAKGLGYLHDRGIVHRDLKPGNVFYDDGYVKIGDYGLSKFIAVSRHSAQTASVGTVHYMAPEVGSGNYSRTIDIYALGVVLYEMLLGKVPFEGSSMGEVLMKHLTAQPAIDDLPAPFGTVIRKALAKDPNERYQTVQEMVDAVFGVDDIRNSMAGFNPTSLSQAAARVVGDLPPSPVHSPNPPPPPPAEAVAAPFGRPRGDRHAVPAPIAGAPAVPTTRKGIILASAVALGIATANAVLFGSAYGDDVACGAFFLTFGLAAGLAVGERVVRWAGRAAEPEWVKRTIRVFCCGLPLLIGADVTDGRGGLRGEAVALGLAFAILAADWRKRFQFGVTGELKIGRALSAGLCAGVAAAVACEMGNGNGEKCFWLAGAIAVGVSLIVQAASWFWPALAGPAVQPLEGPMPRRWGHKGIGAPPQPVMGHRNALAPVASPFARPAEGYAAHAAAADGSPPFRWGITRAFWSVVAFCLFGGAVVLFMMLVLIPLRGGDRPATIFGCIACVSFLIFALSKTTQQRRHGFWRETGRPFLVALCLAGLGALLTTLAEDCWHSAEEMVIVTSGLVICGTLLPLSLFVGRRPPVRREPPWPNADPQQPTQVPSVREPTERRRGLLGLVMGLVTLAVLLFLFLGVRFAGVHRVEHRVVGPRNTYPPRAAVSEFPAREESLAQTDQNTEESEYLVERYTDEFGKDFGTVEPRLSDRQPRYRTPTVPVVPHLLVAGPRQTTWIRLLFLAALPALLAVLALRIRYWRAQHRRRFDSAPNASAPPDKPSE